MGLKFEIKTEKEMNAVWDAIRRYHLKQKSMKDDLAGTHWKKLIYKKDGSLHSTNYYLVVSEKINKKFTLCISKNEYGEYHVSSFGSIHSLNAVDDDEEKLIFLSEKTYREETTEILLKYGLKWI